MTVCVAGDGWSPVEINLLLHIFAIAEPLPSPPVMTAPVIEPTLQKFQQIGLIYLDEDSPSGYRTTHFGEHVVYAIKRYAEQVATILELP